MGPLPSAAQRLREASAEASTLQLAATRLKWEGWVSCSTDRRLSAAARAFRKVAKPAKARGARTPKAVALSPYMARLQLAEAINSQLISVGNPFRTATGTAEGFS